MQTRKIKSLLREVAFKIIEKLQEEITLARFSLT
jgi:hypothetical protein